MVALPTDDELTADTITEANFKAAIGDPGIRGYLAALLGVAGTTAVGRTTLGIPGLNIVAAAGNGLKFLRQKTGEDGLEYRTAAEVIADIAGVTLGTAQALTAPKRPQQTAAAITSSETLNFSTAQNWQFTVDVSASMAIPTVAAATIGQTGTITFIRGSTGGSLSWHANFIPPTGESIITDFSVASSGAKISVPYKIIEVNKVHVFAATTWDS